MTTTSSSTAISKKDYIFSITISSVLPNTELTFYNEWLLVYHQFFALIVVLCTTFKTEWHHFFGNFKKTLFKTFLEQ